MQEKEKVFRIAEAFKVEQEKKKEKGQNTLFISTDKYPLKEISEWEGKLEELDIDFLTDFDKQKKIVVWKVSDEDRDYVFDFLDNLGAEYKTRGVEKAVGGFYRRDNMIEDIKEKIEEGSSEDALITYLITTWIDVNQIEARKIIDEAKALLSTEQVMASKQKAGEDRYTNTDGSFKEMTCPDNPDNKSAFCGCVRKMMADGKSLESAKKICGSIARKATASLKRRKSRQNASLPNVNQVLGTNEELFKHAFVKQEGQTVIVSIGPFDRMLFPGEGEKISNKVLKIRQKLLEKYPTAKRVEVYNYAE